MSDIHTMVGAYAADALSAEERRQFDEHLVDCESCRQEVQEFRDTLARLGPAHAAAPPPEVRHAVLDRISSVRVLPPYDDEPALDEPAPDELGPDVAAGSRGGPGPSTHRGWRRRALVLVAALSLAVNLALGAFVVHQQQEKLQNQQRADADAVARAELMAAPDLRVHTTRMADGTAVSYLVSISRGRALMVASDLARPEDGRSWQLWTIRDDGASSAGLLSTGGDVHVWIDDITDVQALAITDEPAGGSPRPTTEPQAVAPLG